MIDDASGVDVFESLRRYLGSVAYRLLGSVTDAEDVLQEAWLRWRSTERSTVDEPRAYLTTVVTRLCYDQLGSARVRREAYYGEWLPEPLVAEESTPDRIAELGDEVSIALLAVLEELTPAERTAFVLHDVFAVGFEEIACSLDRTPDAARQLASRARRRVRERGHRGRVDPAAHRQVVHAFAAAAAEGDIQGLLAVLDPDVVWHSDGGGVVTAGARAVLGADKVSRLVRGLTTKWLGPDSGYFTSPVLVNGEAGLAWHDAEGRIAGVLAFQVTDGRITAAYVALNPEKLTHVTQLTVTS
ncbi:MULTISPECIES: RNA polymerase sigma factor SigJ [unclassified Kitasatospora]|uniref:RNA polymerase sigma factor SigJ n=1 Tax=unclassified Kitasatospora TaxID=2633591 RepID=UPI000A94AA5E|nr:MULTISPECIES: RNA polymerase sigma factor SigJ [unclassified Kitasatospora]